MGHKKLGKCLICGKEFEYYPSEQDGKYCSQECYKKTRGAVVQLVCRHCGKIFERPRSKIKSDISFCSTECRLAHRRNQVEIVCEVCGKVFFWRASRLKYYKTRFCSKKCAGVARRNRVFKICKNCGKEFSIKKSATERSYPRGAYCSFNCYHEFSKGKNSHMYDHGQTFYPYCELFNNSLRERVRYFFGNKCVISGVTKEGNGGKRLEVHHVFIEKLACCETKIEDMDLVRKRLPKTVAKFGLSEFTEEEIMYIRMMVPLSLKEHSRVHKLESSDMPYEETKYRKFFTELILKKYNGKCCFTEEEFKKVKADLKSA